MDKLKKLWSIEGAIVVVALIWLLSISLTFVYMRRACNDIEKHGLKSVIEGVWHGSAPVPPEADDWETPDVQSTD